MKLLVYGQSGQVAKELARRLPSGVNAQFLDRSLADLTDPAACAAQILAHRPDAVINAAAYTAVDRAESEEDIATAINGHAPEAMAKACATLGIPFVHISTDYVFDGAGTDPFAPDAPIGPLGAYGRSKAIGEAGIRRASDLHAILRTSWVFSAHGANFVKTMLRLSETRDALSVVADQTGGPTPAAAIADACLSIAAQLITDPAKAGTYHFSGSPDVTWAEFARTIFDMAGRTVVVSDIPTSAYPTPALRPTNSRMDCRSTKTEFGIARPDWRQGLHDVLKELEAAK